MLTPGFSLARHACAFGAVAVTGIAVAIWLARRARPTDLWIVPAYLVVANATEYFVHRVLMHRPLWPRRLYQGHTLGHHRAFHHDSMEVLGWRDLELVVMPWFSIAAFFAGISPLALLVAWMLGPGAAGLLLLAGVTSFITYEAVHALYHFPRPVLHRLGLMKSRLFHLLYRHHQHHHRLARMRWMNFNISMPLADRLFGTLETDEAWQAGRANRRSRKGARNGARNGARSGAS